MKARSPWQRQYHFGWLVGAVLIVLAMVLDISFWARIGTALGAGISFLVAFDFPTRMRRRQAEQWAQLHFAGPNQEAARAVAYALVEMLGVDFSQLTSRTDIVTDLGVDEEMEWIGMALEAELECNFGPHPVFTGRTISELVDFVAQTQLTRPVEKPA